MKISLNQNRIKRCLCIALTVLVITGAVPVQAKAETFRDAVNIIDLKQNTTVSASGGSSSYYPETDTHVDTYNAYKITVPANGYIKLNVSNKSTYFRIYTKVIPGKQEKYMSWEEHFSQDYQVAETYGKKTYYYVLPKGVYYINIDGDTRTNLKWTFTKVASKANYCKAKAQTISAGKTYTLVSKYEYDHYRWYKVKLTSRKKLYIKCKALHGDGNDTGADCAVYDSKGNKKNLKLSGVTFRSTAKLPKGTYYIRLRVGDLIPGTPFSAAAMEYLNGSLCQLSWSAK